MASRCEGEWVWGWDSTPGIVSVWAGLDGRATVWRRIATTGELIREEARFRPWLVLDRLDDLLHLGDRVGSDNSERDLIRYRELHGSGCLRYFVSAEDGRALVAAVLEGASHRLGRRVSRRGRDNLARVRSAGVPAFGARGYTRWGRLGITGRKSANR
jgi:DNA polymerase, archaea type